MRRGSTFVGSWAEATDVAATCRESALLGEIRARVTHVKGGEKGIRGRPDLVKSQGFTYAPYPHPTLAKPVAVGLAVKQS